MRSKLFVPATRIEWVAKALSSGADAVSIDLEDSVPPTHKHQAREAAGRFLRDHVGYLGAPDLIVRINAMDTCHWRDDLRAVMQPSLDFVNLPKVESVESLLEAVSAMEALEHERGIATPVKLLVNIESALGLAHAARLAASHARVAGLQVGFGDLFAQCGIASGNVAALQHVRMTMSLAAAQAGVPCYDGAFARIMDTEGLMQQCLLARSFGFRGKTCLHPSQVPIVNAAFSPTAEEIAWAQAVVDAAELSVDAGRGAFMVDGRMVDAPGIKRAYQTLGRIGPEKTSAAFS